MIRLPRSPRTYFDGLSHECQNYPIEQKLLDLGYAIWHGHDIMEDIHNILENHPYISESDIQFTLWFLMARANHVAATDYLMFDRNNSLKTDVGIFIEDLMRVFRLPDGDRKQAYLADDPGIIHAYELDNMNGWKSALSQTRQSYDMYSYGDWVMFPGDGDIIRNFNLEKATQGHGYISYVYPEPWYGSPTHAKLIVLGNEARYDDFISRSANLLLRCVHELAETVQEHVDGWMRLSNNEFYTSYYLECDEEMISPMEVYNSPTYRYWLNQFNELALTLDIDTEEDFYSKLAVINANPYPSIGTGPLAAGMLPSHYFLRQLVRYITNHDPEVRFIIPSESLIPVWRTILGDVYTDLMAFNRAIVLSKSKYPRLIRNMTKSQLQEISGLMHHEPK